MLGSWPQGNDGILYFAASDFLKGLRQFLFRRATIASYITFVIPLIGPEDVDRAANMPLDRISDST